MAAVRPAAEDPLPLVNTLMGATFSVNFKNCDFAVDGSPSKSTFMSPLSFTLELMHLLLPPKSKHAIAFLISA